MTKLYTQKSCSTPDDIDIFPLSNSYNNIWNIFNNDDSDEDCLKKITDVIEFNY